MARVELVVGLVVVALCIYSLVTCALTPEGQVRGIPKLLWLVLIVLLPLLGSVLWLGAGRERGAPRARRVPGGAPGTVRPGPPPPSQGYAALTAEERIRRMEEDLARLESESGTDPLPREDRDRPDRG